MISKKYIKALEFETLEDIYLYIIGSEVNGNYSQAKEILKKLSQEQFKLFCDWFNNEQLNGVTIKPLNWYVSKRLED